MKRKGIGIVLATLAIVALGSGSLILSVTQIKGTVQDNLGEDVTLGTEVAGAVVETEEVVVKDDSYSTKLDTAIKNSWELLSEVKAKELELRQEYNDVVNNRITTEFIYQGQQVEVKDALLEKEEAVANATRVLDYVYSYVDEMLLKPYGIEKDTYSYSVQRQYRFADKVYYAVYLKEEDEEGNSAIQCSLGIFLDEEPSIRCFTRDGLIDLYGGVENPIPEEYLVENWCNSTEKRETIYTEYLDASKEIITEVLGMPAILTDVKNVDNISYFAAGDDWSMVTLGYVLEDGTYIKMMYNRTNQMWNGFVIDGYHEDYVEKEK